MILVSGVPCSGKTTLMNSNESLIKITQDNSPKITLNANTLRANNGSEETFVSHNTVVHYDSLRPFKRNLPGYSTSSDSFLFFLKNQKEIEIITVIAPLSVLTMRLNERKKRLSNDSTSKSRLDKIDRMYHLYQTPEHFMSILMAWFSFCNNLSTSAHHLYLNTNCSSQIKTYSMQKFSDLSKFILS